MGGPVNSTSAPETRLDAAAALSAIEDQQNILHVRTGIRSTLSCFDKYQLVEGEIGHP